MDFQEDQNSIDEKDENKSNLILSKPANKKTAARMRVLIEVYGKTGRLLHACEVAGIDHNTHYRKLEGDPAYLAAFEDAERRAGQRLEDLAYQRAEDGDNQMLHILLKRFKPEQYRERITADVALTVNLAEQLTNARQRLSEAKPDAA